MEEAIGFGPSGDRREKLPVVSPVRSGNLSGTQRVVILHQGSVAEKVALGPAVAAAQDRVSIHHQEKLRE